MFRFLVEQLRFGVVVVACAIVVCRVGGWRRPASVSVSVLIRGWRHAEDSLRNGLSECGNPDVIEARNGRLVPCEY